jgi:hypothetical protein
VQITGAALFGPLIVEFNGITSTSVSTNDAGTAITAVVPPGNTSGHVTVHALGGVTTSTASFTSLDASISSVAPLDGAVGTQVTITGANLVGVSSVSFGTIGAAFTSVSPTQLTATVPAGFSSSKVTVVTSGNGTAVSSDTFVITKVSNLSITSGQARRTLIVFGQGLGSTTAVRFSGAADTAPYAVSATKVTVLVPPDAGTGPISIVTPRALAAGPSFRPLPSLTGITPLAAVRGATVTISGANLGGATSVRFGSFAAGSFTVDSPTQITAAVPSSSSFNGGRVTVATPNGTANSAQSFLVRR